MLLAGHLPRRFEPQPQRRPSAVEDRPRRNRHLTPAHRALPTTAAQPPPSTPHAPRTAEPVRPAQPLKVVEAGSLVREPRQELRVRARVVLACLRHMRTLPELDRYPLRLLAAKAQALSRPRAWTSIRCCTPRIRPLRYVRRPSSRGSFAAASAHRSQRGTGEHQPALSVNVRRDAHHRGIYEP